MHTFPKVSKCCLWICGYFNISVVKGKERKNKAGIFKWSFATRTKYKIASWYFPEIFPTSEIWRNFCSINNTKHESRKEHNIFFNGSGIQQ